MTSERKFIEENVKRVLLKEYLRRKTERSGFGGLDIQRTPMGTRVTLIAERPGMVIGRKGETIKELTDYVQNEFNFDNPQIEVKEVSNPNLNPHIMAQKLANALERGWHFRRAGHSTVRRIMSAGAKGCQVIISGKLTGQRHRTEKFREGHIKYCGETKLQWMHEGYAVAKKKLGVIGVKVQIMDPNARLPDEIEFQELREVAEIKTIPKDESEQVEVEPKADVETEIDVGATDSETEPETKVKDKDDDTDSETKKDKSKETKKKGAKKKEKEAESKEVKVGEELTPAETTDQADEQKEIPDTLEEEPIKEETPDEEPGEPVEKETESEPTEESKVETVPDPEPEQQEKTVSEEASDQKDVED
jgi:small subunit ribosomal protein S3